MSQSCIQPHSSKGSMGLCLLGYVGQPCDNTYPVIRAVYYLALSYVSDLHSTSLFQGKCGALICLTMWVSVAIAHTPSREVWGSDKLDNERQPCDYTYPVIRAVYHLALSNESVLHSTSLLQGKCGTLISLTMRGSLVIRSPVIRAMFCLAVSY